MNDFENFSVLKNSCFNETEGRTAIVLSDQNELAQRQISVEEGWMMLCKKAEEGDPEAQYQVAVRLWEKNPTRYEEEIQYYLWCSAKQHYVPACLAVGLQLDLAFCSNSYLVIAAEKGMAEAILVHSFTQQDCDKEASRWKCVPAENRGEVMLRLALRFKTGFLMKKGEVQALCWLQRAKEAGLENAVERFFAEDGRRVELFDEKFDEKTEQCASALLSANNSLKMQKQSCMEEEALSGIRELAEQGNAQAQFYLGNCYAQGIGVEEDWEEAVQWFTAAEKQGHAGAANNLAYAFDDEGLGTERNQDYARELYQKAAENGSAVALNNLGYTYSNWGNIVDEEHSFQLYEQSAEKGCAAAQHNLGVAYGLGYGIEKNNEKAAKWMELAAEKELSVAQFLLGKFYQDGRGVACDENKGQELLKKAAQQDYLPAQHDMIAEKMGGKKRVR